MDVSHPSSNRQDGMRPGTINATEWIFALCVWVIASGCFWAVRLVELPLLRSPSGDLALSEADAYVRMYLVRNAIQHGMPIRQRFVPADNAPFGRINEWTSPVTWLGVMLTRAVERLTGAPAEAALRLAMLVLGPIVGWLALTALGFLGYRIGGWKLAFCWMLPFSIVPDIVTITRFGNADHHSLHLFLFTTSAAVLVWSETRKTWKSGALLGILGGLALWSAGSELLPLIALLAVFAFVECSAAPVESAQKANPSSERVRGPSGSALNYWRGWYAAGFLTSLLAVLIEFYPRPLHTQLEMISAAHVLMWAVMGWILEHAAYSNGQRRWMHVAAGLAVMAFAVGVMKNWQWSRLHVFQDPLFQREASVTREFEPWARTLPDLMRAFWNSFGALPLAAFGWIVAYRRQRAAARWLIWAMCFYVVLASVQMRWLDFAAPLLIMNAGFGALHFFGKRPAWAPLAVAVGVLPLVAAPWNLHRQIAAAPPEALADPFREAFALEAAADCVGSPDHPPVMLAPWFHGSVLVGSGKLGAIASPYWSNKQGLYDGAWLFATRSPDEFGSGLRRRNVAYILIPDQHRTMRAISQSWILVYGYPPTLEELQQTVIWRIASRNDTPFVRCEALRRLCPDWRVVPVSGLRVR
jgi:hypothetical protein